MMAEMGIAILNIFHGPLLVSHSNAYFIRRQGEGDFRGSRRTQ